MLEIHVGDIVARKSYGFDILFKVMDITSEDQRGSVHLKGVSIRLEADAPAADLEVQPERKIRDERARYKRYANNINTRRAQSRVQRNSEDFFRPGRVLHLDGDRSYLEDCSNEYKKSGIEAVCKYVPEKDQPHEVTGLLRSISPDILVLTGHDGFLKGSTNYHSTSSYRNSRFFIEGVMEARKYQKSLDAMVIIAGACQSMYTEILNAGANFASSPYRVNIHALDPVYICKKISLTSSSSLLLPQDVVVNTLYGHKGVGGIQTRGQGRLGFPKEAYL